MVDVYVMARKRTYTDNQLSQAIQDSNTWAQAIRLLNLRQAGGTTAHLRKLASNLDLDTSHFKGRGFNLLYLSKVQKPLDKLLKNGVAVRSSYLKKRLFAEGVLANKCSECGLLPEWNGKSLVLELDHIDGDIYNNELSNLRILCLHCHSQTGTFRGKNRKKVRYFCDKCSKEISARSKSGMCLSCCNKSRSRR